MKPIKVRAVYRAVKVAGEAPPYDSLALKVCYPCTFSNSPEERKTGIVPADASRAPFPVVVLLPDTDVPLESYAWLASELAQAGMAVATYSWIAELGKDLVGLTPGVQSRRLSKKRYGRKPSCPALPAVFSELKRVNRNGPLAGLLNLSCVILGGHGLGGSMAMLNANKDWFPAVCGAFSYAGHSIADPDLDWKKNTVLPLAADIPLLIMGGTADDLLATDVGALIGQEQLKPGEPVERTFREGLKGKHGDRYLVLVAGADHFSILTPKDRTTGRVFMRNEDRARGKSVRKYLSQVIVTFCDQVCRGAPMSKADLQALCDASHPMVEKSEHR